MTISFDGQRLAVCTNHEVKVWDIATGDELSTFEETTPTSAFDSSGARLVTVRGASIKVWDVMTGEELCNLNIPNSNTIKEIEISPDDSWLVGIDSKGVLHLWDTGRRSQRTRLSDMSQLFVGMTYEFPDPQGAANAAIQLTPKSGEQDRSKAPPLTIDSRYRKYAQSLIEKYDIDGDQRSSPSEAIELRLDPP